MWSYDFVFDHCANGQQLKCLTVTDEFTKEGLAIDVDGRIRSARTIEGSVRPPNLAELEVAKRNQVSEKEPP